jgi:lysophospholipase L1-like esterase
MKMRFIVAGIGVLGVGVNGGLAEPHIAREAIEWCDVWMPDSTRDDLPRVLLIGDSITRGYFPAVEKDLQGKAYCARLATSKSVGDPALLTEIAAIVAEEKFDVIHFNNGMHGWGYSEEEFKAAFPGFVEAIRNAAPHARLVWASITPVRKDDAKNARIKVRNTIAEEYMKQNSIPIDNQWALMAAHEDLHSDDVHFTPAGSDLQARQVADSVLKLIQ